MRGKPKKGKQFEGETKIRETNIIEEEEKKGKQNKEESKKRKHINFRRKPNKYVEGKTTKRVKHMRGKPNCVKQNNGRRRKREIG